DRQRASLLLHLGIRTGGVDVQLPQLGSVDQAQREEHVMVAAQERDHVEPPGRRIDRWSTGDTGDRGDVSAGEGTGVHRLTNMLGQDRLSRKDVARVEGVVFGRYDVLAV